MAIEAWALFCLTEAVLCLQPGPSTMVVISQSLTRGTPAGLRAAAGILVANAIYFGISASGLVALHALSSEAFSVIRLAGAAYLAWLGFSAIRRSFTTSPSGPFAPPTRVSRSFWRGLVVQGANPNLLIYFAAILPQFIDPSAAIPRQVLILACSSFVIEFSVLSGYAVLSSRAGAAAGPRLRRYLERIGGGLLIGAAAGLARLDRAWRAA